MVPGGAMVGDVSVLDPGLVVCAAHDDAGDLAHALGQCIAHGRAPQSLSRSAPLDRGLGRWRCRSPAQKSTALCSLKVSISPVIETDSNPRFLSWCFFIPKIVAMWVGYCPLDRVKL